MSGKFKSVVTFQVRITAAGKFSDAREDLAALEKDKPLLNASSVLLLVDNPKRSFCRLRINIQLRAWFPLPYIEFTCSLSMKGVDQEVLHADGKSAKPIQDKLCISYTKPSPECRPLRLPCLLMPLQTPLSDRLRSAIAFDCFYLLSKWTNNDDRASSPRHAGNAGPATSHTFPTNESAPPLHSDEKAFFTPVDFMISAITCIVGGNTSRR
ncbi:hypothetical protein C8R42DRAFT_638936 [Lentinula raphanica]|nr:hypothetical protein C8R42DRAFT_638936 [Lentinula raphanica]